MAAMAALGATMIPVEPVASGMVAMKVATAVVAELVETAGVRSVAAMEAAATVVAAKVWVAMTVAMTLAGAHAAEGKAEATGAVLAALAAGEHRGSSHCNRNLQLGVRCRTERIHRNRDMVGRQGMSMSGR